MSKNKVKYICTNCSYESLTWLGKCPHCNEWNTFSKEFFKIKTKQKKEKVKDENIYQLSEVSSKEDIRVSTGIVEFDRVLGGGLILGSVVLIAVQKPSRLKTVILKVN